MGMLGAARSVANLVLGRANCAIVRMPAGDLRAESLSPEARIFHAALNARGQVSLEEARFLTELVRSLEHPGPIVEIGTLFGKSTLALAFGKSMDRALLTVDSYCWNPHGYTPDEHFAITKAVLEDACRNFGVEQVRQDKRDFYSDWLARERPAPALVFLDADHSAEATLEDIAWARKAKAHLICGHDYTPRIPGVVEAVDASGGPERLVGTIWVLRQEARPASVLRSKAARA